MIQSWQEPYRLEAAFFKVLAKQKRKGFLVDRILINTHIKELTRWINLVDAKVLPMLPMRTQINETKKLGVYNWVRKPFLKSGKHSESSLVHIADRCNGIDPGICAPFSRISIVPFDLGSGALVKEYLMSQGWVPMEWNYKKDANGKLTKERTSPKLSKDDPFHGVKGSVGKLVSMRMIFRHRRSQLQGFLKLIRRDGRITADVTGLCPTARIKHKGIVNVPGGDAKFGNQMRSVFITPQGYRIIGCDAASCQLRMLCHYMGDDAYTEAVLNGKNSDGTDIHSVNQRLAGLDTRAQAKTFIYALLFGAGDANLAAQLGVSIQMARRKRAQFMSALPKLKALLETLKRVWKAKGFLTGLDGRKIFVRSEHMLLVYLLQSAEAIMMKVATCYADKWLTRGGYDASIIAHVHDEFQWEVIKSDCEKVGELLEQSIVKAGEYLRLDVPMAGESKIGINWKETH